MLEVEQRAERACSLLDLTGSLDQIRDTSTPIAFRPSKVVNDGFSIVA